MIKTIGYLDNAIVNHNFIQRLEKDVLKYDILYICAPFGWRLDSLESRITKVSKSGKNIVIVQGLEKMIEQGTDDEVWSLLSEKKNNDKFVFISPSSIPEKLLPFTILYKFISYGIEDIKPTSEDVSSYMKGKDISLSEEDLLKIEKDCHNFPLYIQLLANLLSNANSGENGACHH